MIDFATMAMAPGLGVARVAVATAATMLAIGVAFLSRPSRATLIWSTAFALTMVASYGVLAGGVAGSDAIMRAALGLLLAAPALLWSGFRENWGLKSYAWAGPALAIVLAVTLALIGDGPRFDPLYRGAILVSSAFGGLFFLDWTRKAERRPAIVLPFALASLAYLAAGITLAVAGFLTPQITADDIALLQLLVAVGAALYFTCALIAVLGLSVRHASDQQSAVTAAEWSRFELAATQAAVQAQQRGEAGSIVFLRLDDVAEIRETAGVASLAALSQRFVDETRAEFSVNAEISSPTPGSVVVVVLRSDASVREHLSSVLERITKLDTGGTLSIHPSASAGWAPMSTIGYDFDALLYMAREAATLASENGGDRWERVGATVTARLLNPTARL